MTPYERWQYYNDNVRRLPQQPIKNYAASKRKNYAANNKTDAPVAWFVSNCEARNNRLDYAKNLSQFIGVDIYGKCGTKKCPRAEEDKCFRLLDTKYKFYLAFENSNCVDYITEKFYVNGLGHDVLPIVMGARREDYERSAPYKSFIHVDDFESPAALAEYLHILDQDDSKYNEYFQVQYLTFRQFKAVPFIVELLCFFLSLIFSYYFQWKGTGEMIDTKFFCRLCALLHDPKVSIYAVFYSVVIYFVIFQGWTVY